MQEKEQLLAKPDITDEDGERLGELEGVIAEEDGYTAESDAAALLAGLGIPEAHHEQPMRELAGGYKLRVLLAQALFGKPEALLLDEPTNNLDLDSIRWLERFLCELRGRAHHHLARPALPERDLHAHRRHRLRDDHHLHRRLRRHGDGRRARCARRVESENAEKQKKIAQLQDFVARFGAGTRASQVQSRKKQIEKLQLDDLKRSNIERPFIQFEQKRPSGKQTLTIEGLTKTLAGRDGRATTSARWSPRARRSPSSAERRRQDHAAARCWSGELEPDAGKITWGHEASRRLPRRRITATSIPKGTTVVEWLHSLRHQARATRRSAACSGRMLFKGEEGMKPTDALSGGEAVRADLRQADADQGQRARARRADQPPRPRVDRRARRRAANVRGHRLRRHPRPRSHRAASPPASSRSRAEGLVDFRGTYDEFLEKTGTAAAGTRAGAASGRRR